MSVFDGLAAAPNTVFGAAVTITPQSGSAVQARGILRELPDFETDDDQRRHFTPTFALQIPKPVPSALTRGATVTCAERPGDTFLVLGVFPDRSPAADAFMIARLELQ